MSFDFKNAKQMADLCEKNCLSISAVMKKREFELTGVPIDEAESRMMRSFEIMKEAATTPLKSPQKSMGGLIGGEAKLVNKHRARGKSVVGDVLSKAITYAMATLEVNASMGLIVAAPTAGSSGVVPGVLISLQEEYNISNERIIDALFNTAAIGYIAMRNATVAGAVGGCQAEVGVAAAMAASAVVELMGGSVQESLQAGATAMINMLGLICDPIAGLVESPCQGRNAAGVGNALIAAELALSGVRQIVPFDEALETMYTVGKHLPEEYRETALGGCASSPSACKYAKGQCTSCH